MLRGVFCPFRSTRSEAGEQRCEHDSPKSVRGQEAPEIGMLKPKDLKETLKEMHDIKLVGNVLTGRTSVQYNRDS